MTLTQTAATFRLTVKVIGLTIVGIVLLRAGIVIYGMLFPKDPPPPSKPIFDAKYGPIPVLKMQTASATFTSPTTVILDMYEKYLPEEPKIANIYPILKAPYGFLSEDRAKDIAKLFGFSGDPIKLNASDNRWTGPNKLLTINTLTLNFSYQYKYSLDSSVFRPGVFSSQAQAIDFAKSLNAAYNITGSFADDLSIGQPQVYMLKYLNQKLQPVNKIADTEGMRIDFNRTPVTITNNAYPFVSPSYIGTTSYTLIGSNSSGQLQAVEVYYRLWRYRADQAGSYPMISSQVAWENIQAEPQKFTVYVGNIELGPMDRNTSTPLIKDVKVKQVYFAYYDTNDEQEYLQPVWVFIGKATLATTGQLDWVGYVPAIDPQYVITQ